MKRFLLAALLIASPAASVHAQLTDTSSPDCAFTGIDGFNWGTNIKYESCFGSVAGNNEGNADPGRQATINQIATSWSSYGTFGYLGTTNANETSGPFSIVPDQNNGTLTFDNYLQGYFVLALKTNTRFSLYLLNATAPVNQVNFKTDGVSFNNNTRDPQPQVLSHATLYGTEVQVPEPASAALVVSGLAGLAAVARRRRNQA